MSVRGVDRAHHSFGFPSPMRERKLSDKGQQEEAKWPKSPEREGVQPPQGHHGSGGEGGEEMEREHMPFRLDMTEEKLDKKETAFCASRGADDAQRGVRGTAFSLGEIEHQALWRHYCCTPY